MNFIVAMALTVFTFAWTAVVIEIDELAAVDDDKAKTWSILCKFLTRPNAFRVKW